MPCFYAYRATSTCVFELIFELHANVRAHIQVKAIKVQVACEMQFYSKFRMRTSPLLQFNWVQQDPVDLPYFFLHGQHFEARFENYKDLQEICKPIPRELVYHLKAMPFKAGGTDEENEAVQADYLKYVYRRNVIHMNYLK